ncbi:hypothetical protein VFPPC_16366 [Pochonia chlamydosporia 170]|uniref:Uncharacterized protein n=1 Tax=Pochonia chlamydosporia 170 TaxID=1380566 RepID=A0A179FAU7_METCM|nr:hypothetical protein VFPPC_16366 [Pochonia chlamydosporia 170]OAQ62655.1 hypothetical protein VFPPC_16366 [Pochonia chlamydosporia 170]
MKTVVERMVSKGTRHNIGISGWQSASLNQSERGYSCFWLTFQEWIWTAAYQLLLDFGRIRQGPKRAMFLISGRISIKNIIHPWPDAPQSLD